MISWSDQYAVGIPVIDDQHKRIVEYINLLHSPDVADGDKKVVAEILTLLLDYTLSHFEFEEALMEQANYPLLEEHQLTHKGFKKQIEAMRVRYLSGENIAGELSQMLLDWLLEHIQHDDVSYVACVKSNILGMGDKQHQSWIKNATLRYFKRW